MAADSECQGREPQTQDPDINLSLDSGINGSSDTFCAMAPPDAVDGSGGSGGADALLQRGAVAHGK